VRPHKPSWHSLGVHEMEACLNAWLKLSNLIDSATERIGRWTSWLILAAVLISAGNAVFRKVFNNSSNGFLEIQWYLFAAVFLLSAGYTLLRQEHVRIDVVLGRFSKRTQIKVEAVCIVLFLFPFCLIVIDLVWPLVVQAWRSGEMSSNAGGLIRWPVFALVPLGFGLLMIQGLSELIKRIAFLRGLIDDPTQKKQAKSAEEELAEFVRAQAAKAASETSVSGAAK
jgi:TRAP-type mannitol/chloroaromatic compound transport system permease small subunit